MRIIRKKYKPKKFEFEKQHRVNNQIQNPQVRVIDESGANLGVINTNEALNMAHEKGLDLIEVSPLANPPVARIQDYNQFKYQESKERKKSKARQKEVELKGIRLSLRIGKNDLDTRINQAIKFLQNNDKVKVELSLRGRELQQKGLAFNIMKKFVETVDNNLPVRTEQEITIMGGKFSTIIAKK